MTVLFLLPLAAAQDFDPTRWHELDPHHELSPGIAVYTVGTLVNVRGAPRADSPVVRRLAAGTRVWVRDDIGPWVEVTVGGATGWVARELLSTMGRDTDLDADGVPERVVVGQAEDGVTRAWIREGDKVQTVDIYPYPDPYLGAWSEVPAAEAGVSLLRVDLNQDSCGAYPTVWLSYAGDRLRTALTVEPWVDGAYGEDFTVAFDQPGHAVVRQGTYGETGYAEGRERACTLTEGVFSCS